MPWTKEIEVKLKEDEDERKRRDKKRAKYCPVCGRKPEEVILNAGRHIYNGYCEKCDCRFVIHING